MLCPSYCVYKKKAWYLKCISGGMLLGWLKQSFSACLRCGSCFPNNSHFCRSCLIVFLKSAQGSNFFIHEGEVSLKGLSYMNWQENKNRNLSKLIMSCKDAGSPYVSDYWGKLLAEKWATTLEGSSKNWIVVPAAGSSNLQKDHAYLLAQSVASSLNLPLQASLFKYSNQSQKQKKLSSRARLRIGSHEKISNNTSVLFVDDIVTSGATAQASFKALGRPKHFEILCLSRRILAAPMVQ